jgi:hypothetical protein
VTRQGLVAAVVHCNAEADELVRGLKQPMAKHNHDNHADPIDPPRKGVGPDEVLAMIVLEFGFQGANVLGLLWRIVGEFLKDRSAWAETRWLWGSGTSLSTWMAF